MRGHLTLISLATPSGRHALALMYGASWHQHHLHLADEFDNLKLFKSVGVV